MDPNGILLITITVFVAFMTIGVWGILFALVRSRGRANDERNAAIRSITEECAEADKVLSSSAKTSMSAHSLKSALLPKIEKILKMLTTNMHILDVYFVKYTESRIAAFQEALVSSESEPAAAPLFPIDKFLSETKPAAAFLEPVPGALSSDAIVEDIRRRSRAEAVKSSDTVLVKGKEREEPIEPPAIDLRTGIITVAQEEPRQPPVAATPKKKPILMPKKQSPEDAFDFEKEISSRVGDAMQADLGQGTLHPVGYGEAPETKVIHTEHTEKTMRWDRDELKGMAGKPESIVVEGTEQVKVDKPEGATKPAGTNAAPQPGAKGDDAIFSGEDIENTLDSFFGLGDK